MKTGKTMDNNPFQREVVRTSVEATSKAWVYVAV